MPINRAQEERSWSCKQMACSRTPGSTIRIPGDKTLSIAEMAEDMALGMFFNNAAEQGKRQATFRRLSCGLNKLQHAKQYLSLTELKTLTDAARLLERLATAAEQAKKEKKRLEIDTQQREQLRRSEAIRLLAVFCHHDDVIEQLLNALTLSDISTGSESFMADVDTDSIDRLVKRTQPERGIEVITHYVNTQLKDWMNDIAGSISDRSGAVVERVKEVRVRCNEQRESSRSKHRFLLDHLQMALAIASSDKIQRLHTDFKKDFF
ncbi:MAG: hypothetical protein HOM14_03875 [Gammaproteobacteria bacterium]|nr:hypothetical protein [Gammaproteobacteria bacterium]MBT4194806.1 hypothetical protein [Gammaproteobacteria bacterium]MBT6550474.1 hypothetical protein [Gammaproteobacteria bacterium]